MKNIRLFLFFFIVVLSACEDSQPSISSNSYFLKDDVMSLCFKVTETKIGATKFKSADYAIAFECVSCNEVQNISSTDAVNYFKEADKCYAQYEVSFPINVIHRAIRTGITNVECKK